MVTRQLFPNNNKNEDTQCQKEVTHLDIVNMNEQSKDNEELSSETDSISLTTDGDKEDEREVIRLQYDEEEYEDEYYVPGIDDDKEYYDDIPGYKRMDLKGESESDKDLIIYSLNESLQIHKEIVDRIEHEKEEMKRQFELEKQEEQKEFEKEKIQAEEEQLESKEKVNKLEAIYQALVKELEAKKLEYQRMESRFHSHIKDIRSKDSGLHSIKAQIVQLSDLVSDLCKPLSLTATSNTLECFFQRWPDMMEHYFENEELDTTTISLLTEKMLWESIMHDILQTPIHPGVFLNDSFGKIYNWVERRNTSWAARLRQQITAFLVNNEEEESIEQHKNSIIQENLNQLYTIYNIHIEEQKKSLKKKWTKIVELAIKLNIDIKCQDNPPIEVLKIEEGTLYNENTMKSYGEGDIISFIVSPPFVAIPILSSSSSSDEDESFLIPAKVYCV